MSTGMTNERLQKLLALKKREEMKDALNAEMKAQYSARGVPSQRIEREVQNFIKCAGLTESNLNRLDRRMQKSVGKKDDDNMSTVTGVSAYSMRSTMTGISKYTESQPAKETTDAAPQGATGATKGVPAPKDELPKDTVKSGSLGVTGAKLAPITEDKGNADDYEEEFDAEIHWADLDKYAALLHERDAGQRKQQITRLQNELRKDLEQQISDNKIRKQKEKESDQAYWESQMGEIDKWKDHEKDRITEQKVKHQKEKEERDKELNYCNSLKKAEADKNLDEDRALLDKIAQELDSEKRLYDTRKKQHREAERQKEAIQAELDLKKAKRAQEMEEDTKQMLEYMKMLEAKEKKTAQDAKDRLAKHAEFLNNIKATGLEDEKEHEAADTARMQQEQKMASTKALALERKKRDNLKAMRLENQSHLFEQMKEKQSIKKKEQEEKLVQAEYLASDTADFHASEQQKLADRKSRLLEHRRQLENQIIANMKYPSGTEVKMSQCEVKMNKRLVKEVKSAMSAA